MKLIEKTLCCHSPDVTDLGAYPNGSRTSTDWPSEVIYACGCLYTPFLTSTYTYPLCADWYRLYRMKNTLSIVLISNWIYLYQLMESMLRQNILHSCTYIVNFFLTLRYSSGIYPFTVCSWVMVSPRYQICFPPDISYTQCI